MCKSKFYNFRPNCWFFSGYLLRVQFSKVLCVLPVILTFLMSGCTSVPLATLAAMAKIDKDFYLGLEPKAVKMIVVSEKPVLADLTKTFIRFDATQRSGRTTQLRFYFRKLNQIEIAKGNKFTTIFFSPTVQTDYVLDDRSVEVLDNLRAQIRNGIVNSVSVGFEQSFLATESNKVSAEVLLNAKQGYIVILNPVKIP
jgi:hypothetical protein